MNLLETGLRNCSAIFSVRILPGIGKSKPKKYYVARSNMKKYKMYKI